MRSGFGFGDMRSRFDLVGVEIAIGFLFFWIGNRALVWLGLENAIGVRVCGYAIGV